MPLKKVYERSKIIKKQKEGAFKMDTVITKLVKMDENARDYVKKADERKQQLQDEFVKKKNSLKVEYEKKCQGILKIKEENLKEALFAEQKEEEKKTEQKISQLTDYFKKNEADWLDRLVQFCIEGET